MRVQRAVERRGLRSVGPDSRVGRVLVDDVVLRAPAAHVVGEDHVGRELSRSFTHCARTTTRGPRRPPARGSPRDRARRARRPASNPDAREEQLDVGPVRRHGRRVAKVRQICVRFVAAGGLRLQEHVVGEHRGDAVRPRVLCVHRRERPVRVPRRPPRPGVDAAREVLVAKAERCSAAEGGRTAGIVGDADLQRVRPMSRCRGQLRGCCPGARDADKRDEGDRGGLETTRERHRDAPYCRHRPRAWNGSTRSSQRRIPRPSTDHANDADGTWLGLADSRIRPSRPIQPDRLSARIRQAPSANRTRAQVGDPGGEL